MENNKISLIKHEIPIRIVVLFSTESGEEVVRAQLLKYEAIDIDLVVCEMLNKAHVAFGDDLGFWESINEKEQAKALSTKLGVKLAKKHPLGFQENGLLITFTRNCPNNSLPILHAEKMGVDGWRPLFKRTFT